MRLAKEAAEIANRTKSEVLDVLARKSFDLALMNVQMPEMDGLTAITLLREREHGGLHHQNVIALSAHAMKGDEERCVAAGMDGFLTKPIRPQEWDAVLARCLATRKDPSSPAPHMGASRLLNSLGTSVGVPSTLSSISYVPPSPLSNNWSHALSVPVDSPRPSFQNEQSGEFSSSFAENDHVTRTQCR